MILFGVFLSLSSREHIFFYDMTRLCKTLSETAGPSMDHFGLIWQINENGKRLGWHSACQKVHDSIGHSMKHYTITLVGRGSEVEEFVHRVAIRLDGVDVLVVWVVGVHHHTQLTALEKSIVTQVRKASFVGICSEIWHAYWRIYLVWHKWSPLFSW